MKCFAIYEELAGTDVDNRQHLFFPQEHQVVLGDPGAYNAPIALDGAANAKESPAGPGPQ